MGQDPNAIRQEIEETRGRMGETAEALGHKTDVTGRAKEAVSEKKDAAVSKVTSVVPDRDQMRRGAKRAGESARSNPLGLAALTAGVGFLVGLAMPSTRMEDEKLGDVSTELKDRARETGHEALERGKEVASATAQAATDTAREQGRQQGEELASSAKENVQQVASNSTEERAPASP